MCAGLSEEGRGPGPGAGRDPGGKGGVRTAPGERLQGSGGYRGQSLVVGPSRTEAGWTVRGGLSVRGGGLGREERGN